MTAPRPRSRQLKELDAGTFQAEIASFGLHLAAGGKAARTTRTYTGAVRWFAAACLPGLAGRTAWEQVDGQDIQRWMTWLLGRYSSAYASNQYRALQQFFRWLAAEAGAITSVGSKGDSYDNALAETIIGLYKAELIRHRVGALWRPRSSPSVPQPLLAAR